MKPHRISHNEIRGRQLYDYYFSTFKDETRNPVNQALSPQTLQGSPSIFDRGDGKIFMDPNNMGFYHKTLDGKAVSVPDNLKPNTDSTKDTLNPMGYSSPVPYLMTNTPLTSVSALLKFNKLK
jgi:hypothetical protein